MYLVVSMTAVTGLLLWMEHLVAPPGSAEAVSQWTDHIAEALRTDRPIEPGSWGEIVISYRDRVPGDPRVALIVPGRPFPYHFVIQPTGEIHTLPNWQAQEASSDGNLGTKAIHVCLSGQPGVDGVSAEQWDALMGMLRQLRARCRMSEKAVRLDPQSDPQYRSNLSQQAYRLRQMLLAADVID